MVQVDSQDSVTQILYLSVAPELVLEDPTTDAGRQWARALDILEAGSGFRRLYWGRRLEEPEKVQIHTVRNTLSQHQSFLASSLYTNDLLPILQSLSLESTSNTTTFHPKVRHVLLSHIAHGNPLAGPGLLGFPIGTAIYKGAGPSWYEGAWPLWTHVVRWVEGCLGIAGGRVLEPVYDSDATAGGVGGKGGPVLGGPKEEEGGKEEEGRDGSYLVYVGWKTVKHHDDYHHTQHFRRHYVILNIGHKGYTEYGHVVFKGTREGSGSAGKL